MLDFGKSSGVNNSTVLNITVFSPSTPQSSETVGSN